MLDLNRPRKTKAAMLAGVTATTSRLTARNTVEYTRPDGSRALRFHLTDIAQWSADGRTLTLDSGGWRTPTTKARMQDVLTAGVRLSQDKGVWWLSQAGDRVAFYDGIAIRDGKLPAPAERNARELARIKKQTDAINKFVRPLLDLSKPLPQPNGGDCWLCMVGHSDCLRSHLKENYLHGTLIANALRHAGLTDIGVALWLCEGTPSASSRRLIAGRVRRYLKAKMGLVAR